MRNLIGRFVRWALETEAPKLSVVSVGERTADVTPNCRIGVLRAMNGRILEVATYKHNPHGPDWTTEMFIVPEDQTLTQALTTLLTLKGLNA